jgi:hypothetical protein
LLVLPAAVVDLGIYWIQLGVPDRGGRIDRVDYVVLPIFPWRRCADANDWRRSRGRLHIPLHHFAAAGLRIAHGCDRTLHRAGDRNVCDAKSRLVCPGRELRHLSIMAEFTVNPKRFDPYKNFKFRIKWDGRYVAGVSRISGTAAYDGSYSASRRRRSEQQSQVSWCD